MKSALRILLSGQVGHPFAGGVKKAAYTKRHVPLVWECMLGTVYARDPHANHYTKDDGIKYFDYNYTKAHAYAKVQQCTDLRICRSKGDNPGPRTRQLALWGIPPEKVAK